MKKSNAEYARDYRIRLKRLVFNHYGHGDPRCVVCNEGELAKLTIEHINNNGVRERKETGWGSNFYSWLKQNNFPDNDYEIRCFSCNCGKRINPDLQYKSYGIYGSLMNRLAVNFNMFLNRE